MKKQPDKGKITALYERLSHDDERAGESVSIENQKRILEDYAQKNGFTNIRHFTDDGVRGTTFKRPGLDAMLEEIRAGNVATVITSLQREANRIYGYTAKQTLDLAQALYEKKLLTYPRTDSSYLTDDMGGTAAQIAAMLAGKLPFMQGADFTPEISRLLDSKKVSDHHAIIPTMELAKADLAALPESERNILTLAGARLLMACAAPHIFSALYLIAQPLQTG